MFALWNIVWKCTEAFLNYRSHFETFGSSLKSEDLHPSVLSKLPFSCFAQIFIGVETWSRNKKQLSPFSCVYAASVFTTSPFLPFKPIFAVSSLNKLRFFSLRTLKVTPRRMWKSLKLDPESVQTTILTLRRRFWSSVTRHETFLCLSHLWRHDGGQRLFEVFWILIGQ